MDQHDDAGGGFDRRSLIKKSAVVGAVAWSAPTIVSSKVHASGGGTCPDPSCDYWYAFKLDNGCEDVWSHCGCPTQFSNNNPVYHGCSIVQNVQPPNVADAVEVTFTLPPGFAVKAVGYKKGPGCVFDVATWVTWTNSDCTTGVRINDYSGKGWSHLEIVVCGPTPPAPGTGQYSC